MKPLVFKEEVFSERSRRNLIILEAIRRRGPISKAEISRLSGVNVVTISNYIDHYIRSNLVSAKALDVSAGGRRPALLTLNGQANLAIGIGLNLMDMIGVVIDLDGNILLRITRKHPGNLVTDVVQSAKAIAQELFNGLKSADQAKIKGIGLGVAGIVDHENNTIRWPEKLLNGQCRYISINTPFQETLEKEFNIPCVVENDATVACFGEQWMALDSSVENLIYMFSGVGSGLILNGEIYRGSSGAAGEIALNSAANDKLLDTHVGSSYFLEPWEDDLSIVRHVKRLLEESKDSHSRLLELAQGAIENITLRDVFQAAKDNDALAMRVVKQAGRRLGVRIAFLINFLNPQMVIIGGGLEEGSSILIDAVKESVKDFAFEEMARVAKIVPSKLGNNAVAMGAASLVIRQVFTQV